MKNFSDFIIKETDKETEDFLSIEQITEKINNIKLDTDKLPLKDSDIIKEIFNYNSIKENILDIQTTTEKHGVYLTEKGKISNTFLITSIIIIPVVTILGIIGFFLKKEKVLLVSSIFTYALIIPGCVIIGLNIGLFLLSIDYCSEIKTHTTQNLLPMYYKGLGYYIYGLNKENMINLSTARYQLSLSFNLIYDSLNDYIFDKGVLENDSLPVDKRNNDLYAAYKTRYSEFPEVVNAIEVLIEYNNVLKIIEPIFNSDRIKILLNFAEENICYRSITYKFEELKFYFVGLMFLIPLAIGINKLIVVVDPQFDKKMIRKF